MALILITGRDPTGGMGGGSNYVRAHARAARAAGFDPEIVCLSHEEGETEEAFGRVCRVRGTGLRPRWSRPSSSGGRLFGEWLAASAATPYTAGWHAGTLARAIEARLAGRPPPHVLHGFYTWGAAGLAVRDRLRARGVAAVAIASLYTACGHETRAKVHGAEPSLDAAARAVFAFERLWVAVSARRVERRVYRRSDRVLLNYESVRRLLAAAHGARPDTRRIPYCAEGAFRDVPAPSSGRGGPGDPPLVVSISRHDPRKGLDVLLRALDRLRRGGVRFRAVVASGGPLLERHRELARQLGLTADVSLPGWLDDPAALVRQADIFALPSLQEGGGAIALLEAMQAGVPAVVSAVDGLPEDVTHGRDGWLVEAGDAGALGNGLGRLTADGPARARIGREARRTFERRFASARLVEALAREYGRLGLPPAVTARESSPR